MSIGAVGSGGTFNAAQFVKTSEESFLKASAEQGMKVDAAKLHDALEVVAKDMADKGDASRFAKEGFRIYETGELTYRDGTHLDGTKARPPGYAAAPTGAPAIGDIDQFVTDSKTQIIKEMAKVGVKVDQEALDSALRKFAESIGEDGTPKYELRIGEDGNVSLADAGSSARPGSLFDTYA